MEYQIAEYLQNTMLLVAKVSAPVLLASLSIGFIVSFFQAVTQLQDQTLTFVPKILGVFIALSLTMLWMMESIVEFARKLFENLPYLIG